MPLANSGDDIAMSRSVRVGGYTVALRIRFDGQDGLRVLRTNQHDIPSLIPWLREILTSLRLPHPKPSNVLKPDDCTSVIEMYWDVASAETFVKAVTNRCRELESWTLQDMSIGLLMVYAYPLTLPARSTLKGELRSPEALYFQNKCERFQTGKPLL